MRGHIGLIVCTGLMLALGGTLLAAVVWSRVNDTGANIGAGLLFYPFMASILAFLVALMLDFPRSGQTRR